MGLVESDEEFKTINWNQHHLKILEEFEAALKSKAGKAQSDEDSASGARARLPVKIVGSSPDKMKGMEPGDLLELAFPRAK